MNNLENLFDEDLELDKFDDNNNNVVENQIENKTDENDDSFFSENNTIEEPVNPLIDELLKARGIESGKIILIDDNDEEKEVSFYDLTKEEQLEILNSSDNKEVENDLNASESNLINHLRSNNLTVEQFLEGYKQTIVDSISNSETANYEIDAYDDEELYMLDLKNKYDLSDEELVKELEKELQDEALFKKKADRLREEYKQLEDQYKENQKLEFEQKQQEEYDAFAQQMVDVAINVPEFYGIELEDDEKNEVLSFLLELDENGVSSFYKTLNDPKKLYEAAWFLRYGKESFDILKNAYESEIAKLKSKDKTPPVVRRNSNDNKPKNSIHDLF